MVSLVFDCRLAADWSPSTIKRKFTRLWESERIAHDCPVLRRPLLRWRVPQGAARNIFLCGGLPGWQEAVQIIAIYHAHEPPPGLLEKSAE